MSHDSSFDRLLDRHARANDGPRAPGECLDAETLAAWTDGSLTSAERSAVEAHAADCDRCLAALATLARMTPPPSVAAKPSWLRVRWLIPLATAAAAVATWVLIRPAAEIVPPPQAPAVSEAVKPPPTPRVEAVPDAAAKQKALEKKEQTASRADARDQRQSKEADAKTLTDRLSAVERRSDARAEPPRAVPPSAAAAQAPTITITSPDSASRWRIVGRTIQRSIDAGVTWTLQSTGTTAELTAGSSPAARVCWVVGRAGLVLLSVDGSTWRRRDFPDASADLVAVTATSDTAATVSTSDGRTYRTTDSGRTWTLQESLAAPF